MIVVTLNPLDHPICLSQPLRLITEYPPQVSAWIEHAPFAMFLIDIVRPKLLVELGTHSGLSYCAFCQAIKELGLDTHAYAIDTWQGDPHAGFYGPEILADLRAHHDPLYGEFSQLLQSTFDGAIAQFADGSIDVLHIDGCHSYEAVKHDFEHWQPKLSAQAVVLFHDIVEREREFGVWQLWEELEAQYPHFEFFHGHGLGMIVINRFPSEAVRLLTEMPTEERPPFRELFQRLGLLLATQCKVQIEGAQLGETQRAWREAHDTLLATQEQLGETQRAWREADDTLLATQAQLGETQRAWQEAHDHATRIHEELIEAREESSRAREAATLAQRRLARVLTPITDQHRESNGAPWVPQTQRILILIPGSVNYFYDLAGRRIAEALSNLGFTVEVATLRSFATQDYAWCFLINIAELIVGYGDHAAAMERLAQVRACSRHTAMVLLDCAETHWFTNACALALEARIDLLIDLGFHDQSAHVPTEVGPIYRFLFNGLTASEQERVRAMAATAHDRVIPWVFVAHLTVDRANLVQRFLEEVDPGGVVYMPYLAPVTEDGPHMNERQLMTLLEHSRLQVWCTHHQHFYMESERFRQSALAGSVPIKVLSQPLDTDQPLPFPYLLIESSSLTEQLAALDFAATRQRFATEFCAALSLEDSLAELIFRQHYGRGERRYDIALPIPTQAEPVHSEPLPQDIRS
jgi:hypothetical protein